MKPIRIDLIALEQELKLIFEKFEKTLDTRSYEIFMNHAKDVYEAQQRFWKQMLSGRYEPLAVYRHAYTQFGAYCGKLEITSSGNKESFSDEQLTLLAEALAGFLELMRDFFAVVDLKNYPKQRDQSIDDSVKFARLLASWDKGKHRFFFGSHRRYIYNDLLRISKEAPTDDMRKFIFEMADKFR